MKRRNNNEERTDYQIQRKEIQMELERIPDSHRGNNGNHDTGTWSRTYVGVHRVGTAGVEKPALETERAITVSTAEDVVSQATIKYPQTEEIPLISNSSAKTYMDYRSITDEDSKQYHHIRQLTVDERGFFIDQEGYIAVALGSYFGDLGEKFIFTLDDGSTIKVVKAEEKADRDTVDGFYHATDGSIIEFVIDTTTEYMQDNINANGYIFRGNFNNCPEFEGTIAKIERVE